jgi:hypothetical protein
MALKSMSISNLQDLRGKVDAAIADKISARGRELEGELSKLGAWTEGGGQKPRAPIVGRSRPSIAIPRTPPKLGADLVSSHVG